MARQAHHHFIPSSYLKGFTEGGEDTSQFWCVPKSNDEPYITRPKDACSKRDYYTVEHEDSLFIEKWYANEIEPKINIALRHIYESESLPSSDDRQNLFLLAATLYLRTPSYRSYVEDIMMRAKEVAGSISSEIKISNISDFDYTKTDLIEAEIRHIGIIVKLLNNKYYRLFIAGNSAFGVVTSDRPFIFYHPKGGKNFPFGLNTPHIEICVPINRNTILIGRNEPFEEGVFPADDRLIGLTNTKLILSTDKFFYSSKSEIALVDDDINVYKHVISSSKG